MAKIKLPITTTVILLVIASLALTITTFAAVTVSRNLPSTGSISVSPNLGLYADSDCTIALSSIDWGSATPGTTITRIVYIKNTGTGATLNLGMTTTNWTPTNANGPITLTWNRENLPLAPGQSTAATLTLTISPSITGITNFSVQININGISP